MKTVVLYTFNVYNDRVAFFVKHGIFKSDDVDFVIICNDFYKRDSNKDLLGKFKYLSTDFPYKYRKLVFRFSWLSVCAAQCLVHIQGHRDRLK